MQLASTDGEALRVLDGFSFSVIQGQQRTAEILLTSTHCFELIVIALKQVIKVHADHHHLQRQLVLQRIETSALFLIAAGLDSLLEYRLDLMARGAQVRKDRSNQLAGVNLLHGSSGEIKQKIADVDRGVPCCRA
ncbi:hypothetical protein [Halochromatium sp.]